MSVFWRVYAGTVWAATVAQSALPVSSRMLVVPLVLKTDLRLVFIKSCFLGRDWV